MTEEGYSVDVLVQWKLVWVAFEVDGQYHFLNDPSDRSANGATLLKRRQLRALGWRVVSVPYWEWDNVKGIDSKSRAYLSNLLESISMHGQPQGTSDVNAREESSAQNCSLSSALSGTQGVLRPSSGAHATHQCARAVSTSLVTNNKL